MAEKSNLVKANRFFFSVSDEAFNEIEDEAKKIIFLHSYWKISPNFAPITMFQVVNHKGAAIFLDPLFKIFFPNFGQNYCAII